jgi:hypothetical protein
VKIEGEGDVLQQKINKIKHQRRRKKNGRGKNLLNKSYFSV